MLKISEELIVYLASQLVFTQVMGTRIFPIVAPEGTDFPFATYRITEQMPLSSSGSAASIELYLWFGPNKYMSCMGFTDLMKTVIEEKQNYIWQSSTPDFSEDGFGYVGIINFNTN
jgi:hypothetical protein